MINPKELRIGSLVYKLQGDYDSDNDRFNFNDDDKIETVVSIDVLQRIANPKEYEIFEPIPLTPEILQKHGFRYSPCGISGADMWQGMAFWNSDVITLRGNISTAKGGILHLAGYFNSQIKYLHQLQNLYFALTGEELQIKSHPENKAAIQIKP